MDKKNPPSSNRKTSNIELLATFFTNKYYGSSYKVAVELSKSGGETITDCYVKNINIITNDMRNELKYSETIQDFYNYYLRETSIMQLSLMGLILDLSKAIIPEDFIGISNDTNKAILVRQWIVKSLELFREYILHNIKLIIDSRSMESCMAMKLKLVEIITNESYNIYASFYKTDKHDDNINKLKSTLSEYIRKNVELQRANGILETKLAILKTRAVEDEKIIETYKTLIQELKQQIELAKSSSIATTSRVIPSSVSSTSTSTLTPIMNHTEIRSSDDTLTTDILDM